MKNFLKDKRGIVVMMIVVILVGAACSTAPTQQPLPTFTNQQAADNAMATAAQAHIDMCNDLMINHANEIVFESSETWYQPNLHDGKSAILNIGIHQLPSDCGGDIQFRAVYTDMGFEYFDLGVNEILNAVTYNIVKSDGAIFKVSVNAVNYIIITDIKNFGSVSDIVDVQVVFPPSMQLPKQNHIILNTTSETFGAQFNIEYMSFGDWWVTPSATPGGYTLNPETTPLPIVPTSTEKYGWLDFLSTSTPMPTQSPTPTASFTPPSQ